MNKVTTIFVRIVEIYFDLLNLIVPSCKKFKELQKGNRNKDSK